MGALAFVAAFVVGTARRRREPRTTSSAGFPGDLFVILVGVTLLFAIAKDNGTVDWLVTDGGTRRSGRIALIPWVMFAVTGTAHRRSARSSRPRSRSSRRSAWASPLRYRINPILMGLMIINGASAGGFSPHQHLRQHRQRGRRAQRPARQPLPAVLAPRSLFNVLLSLVVFVLFGGRELLGDAPGADLAGPRRSPRHRSAAARRSAPSRRRAAHGRQSSARRPRRPAATPAQAETRS